MGGWVAGVEADIRWSNIRSNFNASVQNFCLDAGTEVKSPLVIDNDIEMHTVKAGLNYSFH